MENKKKMLFIIILIIIACSLGAYIIINKVFTTNMRAIVIKVNDKYLDVMRLNDSEKNLYEVAYSKNNNIDFKQGQEILIYYNGIIEITSPAKINNVNKIKIIKQKSEVQIPNEVLKRFYSSTMNVSVSIDEISNTGISLIIKDTNEYKYEYFNKFTLNKKQEIWKEVPKIASDEKTVLSKDVNNTTIKTNYKWEKIYGKLESGEYQFIATTTDKNPLNIIIYFNIDEKDKISYEKPQFHIFF